MQTPGGQGGDEGRTSPPGRAINQRWEFPASGASACAEAGAALRITTRTPPGEWVGRREALAGPSWLGDLVLLVMVMITTPQRDACAAGRATGRGRGERVRQRDSSWSVELASSRRCRTRRQRAGWLRTPACRRFDRRAGLLPRRWLARVCPRRRAPSCWLTGSILARARGGRPGDPPHELRRRTHGLWVGIPASFREVETMEAGSLHPRRVLPRQGFSAPAPPPAASLGKSSAASIPREVAMLATLPTSCERVDRPYRRVIQQCPRVVPGLPAGRKRNGRFPPREGGASQSSSSGHLGPVSRANRRPSQTQS